MQQYYNKENIGLNYLCCYVIISWESDGIKLINTALDTSLKFFNSTDIVKNLISDLQRGITYSSLIERLDNISDSAHELYEYMLQIGLLE